VSADDLQKRLERLGQRLLEDVEHWEALSRGPRRRVVERLEHHVNRAMTRQSRLEEKRARRAERRAQKREEELEGASVPGGVFLLAVALVCAGVALVNPQTWWLIFVALGIGSGGARQIALAQRRDRAALPAPTAPTISTGPTAAATNDIDPLCDQLLADLQASPEAVRAFVVNPVQTIESLRATCHALATRRSQLGNERALDRLRDVEQQRRDLALRRDAAGDATARQKLNDALVSLEGQASALRQLSAAYERVDGEYTSLLVTLQELRTRVSLAKTAGSGVQLDGLKASVARLNGELEAITDALGSAPLQPVAPISSDDSAPNLEVGQRER
jgi:hypothetical protein